MKRHPLLRPLDDTDGLAPTARGSAAGRSTTPSAGVAVIQRNTAAGALVDPDRRRILAALHEPGSATTVAHALGLSRQRANYHVRALERAGLVEQVGQRQRRGLTERLVRATAAHYLVAPDVLGTLGDTSAEVADRFSATFQVAVAARTIREVAALADRAREAGRRLTTLTIDTSVRFATPARREAFANELVDTVARLVAKYHDAAAGDGRTYRLFIGAHPEFPAADQAAASPAQTKSRLAGRHTPTKGTPR